MIPFVTGATGIFSLPGSITPFAGKIKRDLNSTADSAESSGQGISEKKLIGMGWLVCDGRPLPKNKYLELYNMLGDLYGSDNDTFNLPDYRGMFLRGIFNSTLDGDNQIKKDLQQSSNYKRTAATGGTDKGIGSTQVDAFQEHEHMVPLLVVPSELTPGEAPLNTVQEVQPESKMLTINVPQTGPSDIPPPASAAKYNPYETRPSNIFVYYLIRWTSGTVGQTKLPPLPH